MKKLHVAIISAVLAVAGLVALNISGTDSQAIRNVRDCDSNAIMYCGALSQSELIKKYDQNKGDVKKIYAHYGITRNDLTGKTSQVKIGKIHKDGRVEVDGKTVATGAYSVGRHNMSGSRKVTINGKTYYERSDTRNFLSSYIDAFVLMRNGKFYRAVMTSCGNPTVAKAKETPKFACNALKATKISRTEYDFKAQASASGGATVSKYTFDFGDGKKVTQTSASVKHTYAKAGTYKVKVTVQVKVSGSTKTVTSKECETTITVPEKPVVEKPVTPIFKCDTLSARVLKLEDRSYIYDLTYTAKDGATLKNVDFDFGDGQKQTVTPADLKNVTHTYAKAGDYKTTATLHFSVTSQGKTTIKDVNCETKISITPEACPLNPSLPKDDERCAPCEIPGKEMFPKDSPECVEAPVVPETPKTPEAPKELPKTGAGEILGGGFGLSAIIAAGYYWHASRRGLIDALMNR